MRTKEEMFGMILEFAAKDSRIRLVGLNGSRTNPAVVPDEFQDYDVVFLVDELSSFLANHSWVDYFGQRIILQLPDEMNGSTVSQNARRFAYLMQFADGNRIDLSLRLLDDLERYLQEDSLVEILLDKDKRVSDLPAPSERSHFVIPPSLESFWDCHNEFWWVATYVAKGLCRGELLYAVRHLHDCVLGELLTMIRWAVSMPHDFKINLGHSDKFLGKYLSAEELEEIHHLYRQDSIEHSWTALLQSFDLMRRYSLQIEDYFGYPPYEDGKKVQDYVLKLYERLKRIA